MTYLDIVGIPDPSKANVNSLAVDDPDAAALAIHSASTAAHGLGATWQEKYVARGLSRSGITVGQAGVFFDDFTDLARWRYGGPSPPVGRADCLGGVVSINFGVNGIEAVTNGTPGYIPRVAKGGARYYFAARVRFPVAMGVGNHAIVGIFNGGHSIIMGSGQGLAKFMFALTGAGAPEVLMSTVSVDTNWHIFESWYTTGPQFYFSVDDETPVPFTPVNAPTTYMTTAIYVLRAGAGNAAIDVDKYLCVFPQAA